MGVWIETLILFWDEAPIAVTPCVGVWIETFMSGSLTAALLVTPCVGVWIETFRCSPNTTENWSHPAWVCGLKHTHRRLLSFLMGHTLRGCVDWNSIHYTSTSLSHSHTLRGCVDWNYAVPLRLISRALSHPAWVCGLKLISVIIFATGSGSHPAWVCGLKLQQLASEKSELTSHPAWVCGLKQKIQQMLATWV